MASCTIKKMNINIYHISLKNYTLWNKKGNKNLNDTYADDLTLFLKLFMHNPQKNKQNIQFALDCFDKFYTWSGLKIN